MTQQEDAQPSNEAHYNRTTKIWLFVLAGTIIIGTLAFVTIGRQLLTPSFPKGLQQQAAFSLYYPTKLPAGYTINESTYSYESGVVQFTIGSDKGNIVVTQQAKPTAFDIESVKKGNGMTETRDISIPNTQAIVGTVMGRQTAIIVKTSTIITLVNTGQPTEQIDTLIQGLAK